METCPSCTRGLDEGLMYLDGSERPVQDQARASWKTCPRCSELAGRHVFLPYPTAFGTTRRRITEENPAGVHSWCTFHRNRANTDSTNKSTSRRVCGDRAARMAPAARPPTLRPAPREAPSAPPPADVPLSPEQLDALVMAQIGWLQLDEEGRRVLRTHLETERKPANRQAILRLRQAAGPLRCDACDVNLAERYGEEHATVVELHHVRPLALGVQRAKGTDDFKLLCPTCHRVVHYRRVEPLRVEELRQRLGQA